MIPVEIGPFLVFLVYTMQAAANHGERLSTDKAFSALAIISLLTDPAREVLSSYPTLVSAMGCVERIHAYLSAQDTLPAAQSYDGVVSNEMHQGIAM